VTAAYVARIKAKEGTVMRGGRHVLYRDSVGKQTIGWGRNIEDRGISDAEATLMLENDIAEHWGETRAAFPWFDALDDVRQEVIAEMAFNMGVPTLSTFHATLGHVKRGEYLEASRQMLKSRWATQVKGRAKELSHMMRTGVRL
jgi:lysozyme